VTCLLFEGRRSFTTVHLECQTSKPNFLHRENFGRTYKHTYRVTPAAPPKHAACGCSQAMAAVTFSDNSFGWVMEGDDDDSVSTKLIDGDDDSVVSKMTEDGDDNCGDDSFRTTCCFDDATGDFAADDFVDDDDDDDDDRLDDFCFPHFFNNATGDFRLVDLGTADVAWGGVVVAAADFVALDVAVDFTLGVMADVTAVLVFGFATTTDVLTGFAARVIFCVVLDFTLDVFVVSVFGGVTADLTSCVAFATGVDLGVVAADFAVTRWAFGLVGDFSADFILDVATVVSTTGFTARVALAVTLVAAATAVLAGGSMADFTLGTAWGLAIDVCAGFAPMVALGVAAVDFVAFAFAFVDVVAGDGADAGADVVDVAVVVDGDSVVVDDDDDDDDDSVPNLIAICNNISPASAIISVKSSAIKLRSYCKRFFLSARVFQAVAISEKGGKSDRGGNPIRASGCVCRTRDT